MDGAGIVKLLAPQVPSLAGTALWHTLGRTPNSSKWDLRTELTVQVLRFFMGGAGRSTPSPIGKVQAMSAKIAPVKGKTWVATAVIKAPSGGEETFRTAVFKAVEELKIADVTYTRPELVDIEVEWTGFRPQAGKDEPLPKISEEEKYKKLMAEPYRTSETTILYFHGGAYYLADPASHRPLTSRLAKESNGRVCSVRYRLAPQAAFPAQLLDALLVYLTLLYPPPGSMHEAVPAKHIVFGGDSAGGNLAFALLQLLLQFHRTSSNPTVTFYGKEVEVPLPAGVTANSGWFDICRSLPSILGNVKTDYLPPPSREESVSRFPSDNVWPTNPPRGDLFCDLSLLDHPLVSPAAAESWANSPPLWLNTGEEMLTDEDKVVVARAAQDGVSVHYEEYEAMPHCFPMLIPHLKNSTRCVNSWAQFCRKAVEEPGSLKTNGTYIFAKTGKDKTVDVQNVSKLSVEEARHLMKETKALRMKGYQNEANMMPKPAL